MDCSCSESPNVTRMNEHQPTEWIPVHSITVLLTEI